MLYVMVGVVLLVVRTFINGELISGINIFVITENIISGNANRVIFGVITGGCVGVVFAGSRNVSPDFDAGGRRLDSHGG
jgi:hypothetical protein